MDSEAREDKKFTREQFERLYNTLTDEQKRQIEELEEQTEDAVEYFCERISEICQALIFTVLSFFTGGQS